MMQRMAKSKPKPKSKGGAAQDRTSDLVAFVKSGASLVTLSDFTKLEAELPQLRKELVKLRKTSELPHLVDHLEFLAGVVGDFVAGQFPELPCVAAAEAAFALQYFIREVDIIPDFIPDIGLVDDAAIALIVLKGNETALRNHPGSSKIDWKALHG
jgi:uncharacterized membrane protein YkvA (DUF1232 family)